MEDDITAFTTQVWTDYRKDAFGREGYARHSLLLDAGFDGFDGFDGPRRPNSLSLDTVMDGRPRASNSRLLQLPAEILAHIVDVLAFDRQALASLALANSDCRQLARCAQFTELSYDYSVDMQHFFTHLASERAADPAQKQPGIGSCVRRVTYAPHPRRVSEFHIEMFQDKFSQQVAALSGIQTMAHTEANQHYVRMRTLAMRAICTAMPNLEVFVWKDCFSIDKGILLSLFRSPAQHVRLERVAINDVSCLEQPLSVASWPLRSLDFGISFVARALETASQHAESEFYKQILQICAPTLETLRWSWPIAPDRKTSFSGDPGTVLLPQLQQLRLVYVHIDAPTLSLFLASPLRHLELPRTYLEDCASALGSCGTLRSLVSFVVPVLPGDEAPCVHIVGFLARHTHIQRLYVHEENKNVFVADESGTGAQLDRCIIPALANNCFDNLRSLSLAWGGGPGEARILSVSDAALAGVATLVTLEQLHLSVGIEAAWQSSWLVDHAQLRRHLCGLPRLKVLALARDTYKDPEAALDEGRVQGYYAYKFLTPTDYDDASARPDLDVAEGPLKETDYGAIWERAHRNRMVAHVDAYAAAMPALEWMLCGQWPIGIGPDPQNPAGPRKGVPLSPLRSELSNLIGRTFGISADNDYV